MEQLEIIIPGGQKLSVRDFIEWEYNGGKADFQPDEHYPLWGTVPIEDKLRYIAISVFGDLASYGKYNNRIGVPGGVIVTYCAKGEVRRGMQAAGFEMSRLPGPPGKRHILRGIKN